MARLDSDHPEALALAQLFSTCVECFGLIHPSNEWDRPQRIAIAKIGIQQGRLLAWGDMVGILDVSEHRDARLEEPELRVTIETALQDIVDRPAHTDRETQFEKYGLKPPTKFARASQPALDVARIESFRERLEILQKQRWEVRRGMSVTISHWMLHNVSKFQIFLDLVKEKVDFLCGLMNVETKVNTAIRYDIRALGWHPIFDKMKASYDMSKLKLIQDACATDYPEYVQAAQQALDYLSKEYQDNYEEVRAGVPTSTEVPGAAQFMATQEHAQKVAARIKEQQKAKKQEHQGSGRPSFLKMFRRKSSQKNIVDGDDDIRQRSKSVAPVMATAEHSMLSPPLTPERSKSLAVPNFGIPEIDETGEEDDAERSKSEDNVMTKVDTATGPIGEDAGPVTSMVSRRDYWKSPW